MSWLTDLYIFGKIIDRTERKMKEKNDQAARNLKRLYDAEKNFYEKQHIQKENERKEQAEEEKIKYLTTGIPEVIKKKNEAFFANYLNRFNALIEETKYFDLIFLMNEALFRLGEIEGMYFSRSMQGWKKDSPIFSFFTEDECLNQSFIDLLINSITLNITIIKKNEDVVGGFDSYYLKYFSSEDTLKKWQKYTKVITRVVSEVSAIESIYFSKSIEKVVLNNFEKVFQINGDIFSYSNISAGFSEEHDKQVRRFIVENFDEKYVSISKIESDDGESERIELNLPNNIEFAISESTKKASSIYSNWKEFIKKINKNQKEFQNHMYSNGGNSEYWTSLISYIEDTFKFNPFEMGTNRSMSSYLQDNFEKTTIQYKLSEKTDQIIYISSSSQLDCIPTLQQMTEKFYDPNLEEIEHAKDMKKLMEEVERNKGIEWIQERPGMYEKYKKYILKE
ncbi:hypothetical protein HED42_16770 [Enterococcus casseliflavus]|uniref:hypothetical protein n=1 Tax=Enterococcus casseliflavus TaxID=37734 RepID=UPI00143334DA|nr:hypothetical protein [Enterococcus casseliflavus]NKD39788.1 hypothetical protein [Enterococcus casseliflavus]